MKNEYIIKDQNTSYLIITRKNKQKITVIIDTCMVTFLQKYQWKICTGSKKSLYVGGRKNGETKLILIHRLLLNCPDSKLVDHINNNPLDNRKVNLRITNYYGNTQNARKRKDNTSGYKGVHFNKKTKKYIARIQVSGKRISLGSFSNPKEAAKAYNDAAKKYHKEYAKINKL